MEEKEMREFSWTCLFAVTSVCFLCFSFFTKLLDGSHVSLFFKIGIGCLVLTVLALINQLLIRKEARKEKPEPISPIFQEKSS